ncbi:hypothetical protein ACFL0B_07480, partial [Thermodesulfobacteriota bacterium]
MEKRSSRKLVCLTLFIVIFFAIFANCVCAEEITKDDLFGIKRELIERRGDLSRAEKYKLKDDLYDDMYGSSRSSEGGAFWGGVICLGPIVIVVSAVLLSIIKTKKEAKKLAEIAYMDAQGRMGEAVYLFANKIVLTKHGIQKEIYLNKISSINFQKPSLLSKGLIQFNIAGESKGLFSMNSVRFGMVHAEEFIYLKNKIEKSIASASRVKNKSYEKAQITKSEELRKCPFCAETIKKEAKLC